VTDSPDEVREDGRRTHSQDPAEGASEDQRAQSAPLQAHAQDPAEGADDTSATTTGQGG
jgi:hypothetical protein